MKTSQAGLEFIAKWEGTVLHVYYDIAGKATIGVGHLLTASEIANNTFAGGITQAQALALLASDVGVAENDINTDVTVPLTQNEFDALASFTFNMGGGALASSTLLRMVNQNNFQGAADQFPLWCHAVINGVLTENQGLLDRRNAERAVFLTPDAVIVAPPPPPPPVPTSPPSVPVPVPAPVVPDPTPAPVVPAPEPEQSVWASIISALLSIFGRKA